MQSESKDPARPDGQGDSVKPGVIPAALLPCPFCGSCAHAGYSTKFGYYFAGCIDMDCNVNPGITAGDGETAIAMWNQRATASEAIATLSRVCRYIERVEEELDDVLGKGRSSERLVELKKMPSVYYEVCKLLAEASATQHEGTKPSS